MVDFIIVGLERVSHDEEIAAVAGDRVPVNYIGDPAGAGLEKSNCPRATRCARVTGRNMRRTRTPDAVVPLRDSFAGRDGKEQSASWIDVVVFEVDALQPWVIPAQSLGFDKLFQQPFLCYPIDAADQRVAILRERFENESPVFQ